MLAAIWNFIVMICIATAVVGVIFLGYLAKYLIGWSHGLVMMSKDIGLWSLLGEYVNNPFWIVIPVALILLPVYIGLGSKVIDHPYNSNWFTLTLMILLGASLGAAPYLYSHYLYGSPF
jgi:hypothetical protein